VVQGRALCVACLAASALACGPVSPARAPLGLTRDAIVGGTADTTDVAVFALETDYYSADPPTAASYLGSAGCSATLIASKTLLTAAHCIDSRGPDMVANGTAPTGTVSVVIGANNTADVMGLPGTDYIVATAASYSPDWDPTTTAGDVGLVLLSQSPSVLPRQWNTLDVTSFTGQDIRVVGYGITGPDAGDYGIRREVDLQMLNIAADTYQLGNESNEGLCHGDSGGPSFHTFADGVERQVGLHSLILDAECTLDLDRRTDYYQSFIQGWLTQNDPPTCAADGACVAGCTPVDPDCVVPGQPCLQATQCSGRECVSDPQHSQTYCSQPCSVTSDCPLGMFCNSDVCNLLQTCTGNSDCGTGLTCVPSGNGTSYCSAPPVTLAEASGPQGPAASGCESGGGGLPVLGLLLALGVLRRRVGLRRG
jgi:hypothetical protein